MPPGTALHNWKTGNAGSRAISLWSGEDFRSCYLRIAKWTASYSYAPLFTLGNLPNVWLEIMMTDIFLYNCRGSSQNIS